MVRAAWPQHSTHTARATQHAQHTRDNRQAHLQTSVHGLERGLHKHATPCVCSCETVVAARTEPTATGSSVAGCGVRNPRRVRCGLRGCGAAGPRGCGLWAAGCGLWRGTHWRGRAYRRGWPTTRHHPRSGINTASRPHRGRHKQLLLAPNMCARKPLCRCAAGTA